MIMKLTPEIQALDAHIYSLEAELADLKHRRNSLLTICRLPDEIVVEIFKIVQHGCQEYDELQPWKTYDSSWVDLMITCRHFREVAVQAPLLWTLVDYSRNKEWTDLCLTRSGKSALYVNDMFGLGSVAECFHQARSAQVQVTSTAASDVINSNAPQLRMLWVDSHYSDEDEPFVNITHLLLGSVNTSLIQLHLATARLLALPSMTSLHRLELEGVFLNNMDTFVSALRSTPLVAELCIRRLIFFEKPTHIDPSIQLLPRLRSLFVDDNRDQVLAYLRVLHLPTNALGISIQCGPRLNMFTGAAYYDDGPRNEISAIWSRFANKMRNTIELTEAAQLLCHILREA
jgi:hypothetical protein